MEAFTCLLNSSIGRVLNHTVTVGASSSTLYGFSYEYNDLAMKAMVYPSGRRTDYGFDEAGRVNQVTGQKSGGTVKSFLSSVTYAPHGAMNGGTLGPVTYSAEFNNRLQPTSLTYAKSGGTPFQMSQSYPYGSNNGNMSGQTVSRNGQSWTASFTYDEVNRLSSASESGSGGWSRGYGFDRWGNLWVNSATGIGLSPFTPTSASNFLPPSQSISDNRLRLQASSHTVCGELAGIGGYTFDYNGEGLLATITLNGGTVSYLYDGEGRRVVKRTTAGDTVYVRDAGGEVAAEYGVSTSQETGTRYVVTDALGSTRGTLKDDGTMAECFDYLPYGEEIPSGVNGRGACFGGVKATGVRFTGKERDAFVDGTATGLDYFGARYYSGAQGRFTSPDWSETPEALPYADLSDPQTLNLYVYVLNNPLSRTDPDGHCPWCIGALIGGGGGAAGSIIYQKWTHPDQDINWKKVGAATLGGAVAGAIFGLATAPGAIVTLETTAVLETGVAVQTATGGIAGVAGGITSRAVESGGDPNQAIGTPVQIGTDFAMGATTKLADATVVKPLAKQFTQAGRAVSVGEEKIARGTKPSPGLPARQAQLKTQQRVAGAAASTTTKTAVKIVQHKDEKQPNP